MKILLAVLKEKDAEFGGRMGVGVSLLGTGGRGLRFVDFWLSGGLDRSKSCFQSAVRTTCNDDLKV